MNKEQIFRLIVCFVLIIMFIFVVKQYIQRNKASRLKPVVVKITEQVLT